MESPANATLLNAGTKCKADHCGLYDFLPYKCQFCSESYCSDHFRPTAHHCEKYISSDRIAPPCPFCQTPISIKPNEDPNDAMETHFNTSCAVMLGSDAAAKSKTPRCSRNKCEKVLYTPITCEACNKQFCATHRHPDSHKCVTTPPSSSASPSKATPVKGKQDLAERLRAGLNINSSSPSSSSSPSPNKPKATSSSPATAAARRTPTSSKPAAKANSISASNSTPVASTSSDSKTPGHNPFSKVDRWVSSSSSSTSSPSTPSASPVTTFISASASSTGTTPLQAIVDSNAQKPKPHLLFSSFVPPSLFGTA